MTRARLPIRDDSDVVVARRTIRELGGQQGMAEAAIEAMATAVTEIARNILGHAHGGELVIEAAAAELDPARRGLVVTARDSGPGISNVDVALRDGYSTVGSLGLGLPSAQRLVDEFEIQSTVGVGTTVIMRKWTPPASPKPKINLGTRTTGGDATTTTKPPLRVLFVEDSERDAELASHELQRGYAVECRRVETAEEMRVALAEQRWDVVLSDFAMPRFSGPAALQVLKDSGQDLPFIIISGTIGEETAVDCLKAGAHDFLVKDRLARLLPAIERERREAEIRRERTQALADLKEAVKVRDEFLSIASHELKTPLTALELQLATALAIVRAPAIPGAKLEAKLAVAAKQVDRLTLLVNNLLDVTRIAAGQLITRSQPVGLKTVVDRVVERFQGIIQSSGSELKIQADDNVVGSWDPVCLESVVGNLISNAVKFGQGRPIEIAVDRSANEARLVVRDHGIGIPGPEQQRIFERFERAVPSQHYGGFGIGLWVTKQVVDALRGAITVSSSRGHGSTFVVRLPLQEHE